MSRRGRYIRGSYKTSSRGSSSNSDVDPREKIKDCCRKFVAFMCTQVGVGGLLVCYTLIGAAAFLKLEGKQMSNLTTLEKSVISLRHNYSAQLFTVATRNNIFNYSSFIQDANIELLMFQKKFVALVEKGYRERDDNVWTYPSALMFSLSTITMIGYGNIVPKSGWGKATTVIYSVFGIPLYILYFLNMGKVLSGCFRAVYTWLYECTTERNEDEPPKRIVVPSTACLWVMGAYIMTGTIMFANWENWSYLDSAYFCVTSLCKLGFGDLVPGANLEDSKEGNYAKLVINFVYMLVGLGLVAMCYNLMREQVRLWISELSEDVSQCLEDTRMRFMNCCKRVHCCERFRGEREY